MGTTQTLLSRRSAQGRCLFLLTSPRQRQRMRQPQETLRMTLQAPGFLPLLARPPPSSSLPSRYQDTPPRCCRYTLRKRQCGRIATLATTDSRNTVRSASRGRPSSALSSTLEPSPTGLAPSCLPKRRVIRLLFRPSPLRTNGRSFVTNVTSLSSASLLATGLQSILTPSPPRMWRFALPCDSTSRRTQPSTLSRTLQTPGRMGQWVGLNKWR